MKKLGFLFVLICLTPALASNFETELQIGDQRGNCTVRTYFEHNVTGNRCRFWDEVMVGITSTDPMVIRCARLDVSCRQVLETASHK